MLGDSFRLNCEMALFGFFVGPLIVLVEGRLDFVEIFCGMAGPKISSTIDLDHLVSKQVI
jgi:hypothetical protein